MRVETEKETSRKSDATTMKTANLVVRCFLIVVMMVGVTIVSCDQTDTHSSSKDLIHDELPSDAGRQGDVGATRPEEGLSGIPPHEHEPRHGGVVRSVDVYHVELVQDPLEIWLYGRRGHLLPMDDVEGQIVVYADDKRHPYPLEVVGDHLSPREAVDLPDEGDAFLELTIGKHSIDAAFELPLDSQAARRAGSHGAGAVDSAS